MRTKAECPLCYDGCVIVEKTDYGIRAFCERQGKCSYSEENTQ